MDNNLKQIRNEKNITQQELSEKSGIARSIISELENGRSESITTKTMVALAKALGVPVKDIFIFL